MQPQSIIVVSCATAAGRRRKACRSARTNGTAAHGASDGCQWPRFHASRVWERGLTFVCPRGDHHPRHRSLTPSPTVWACSARYAPGGRCRACRGPPSRFKCPCDACGQRAPAAAPGRPRWVAAAARRCRLPSLTPLHMAKPSIWTVFSTKIAGQNHF